VRRPCDRDDFSISPTTDSDTAWCQITLDALVVVFLSVSPVSDMAGDSVSVDRSVKLNRSINQLLLLPTLTM